MEAFVKARNKRKTREAMMDAGLVTPKFCKTCDAGDLDKACKFVGFPAVLKLVYGSGGIGVMFVDSLEKTRKAYQKLFRKWILKPAIADAELKSTEET